jgi:hypothetical protein
MTWARCRCVFGGVFAVADVVDVVQYFVSQWPRTHSPSWAGWPGGIQADGIDGDGPPFRAGHGLDAASDADGRGGVREGPPGGDRSGLEGAVFLPAVAATVLASPAWASTPPAC